MTRLPATFEHAEMAALEAEAVDRARRFVRKLKSGAPPEFSPLPPGVAFLGEAAPTSWFGRENSRSWAKTWLKRAASNPNLAAHVCSLARSGSTPADEALRDLIREHKEHDEKLFTSLRAYDIEITQSAGRRRRGGWERAEVALRDIAVLCVIVDICYAFGLPPTRSRTSKPGHGRLSGCYIAALALKAESEAISESAVVKVWTRYSRLVAPEGGWSRYLDERA
jgi:hypothetical protein